MDFANQTARPREERRAQKGLRRCYPPLWLVHRLDQSEIEERVLRFVSNSEKLAVSALKSRSRKWPLVWGRWLAIVLARKAGLNHSRIGRMVNRSRTTVHHGLQAFQNEVDTNKHRAAEADWILRAWKDEILKGQPALN